MEGIGMCEPHGFYPEGDVFKGQKVRPLQDEAIHLKIPVSLCEPTMWATSLFFSYGKELPSFKCCLPP